MDSYRDTVIDRIHHLAQQSLNLQQEGAYRESQTVYLEAMDHAKDLRDRFTFASTFYN